MFWKRCRYTDAQMRPPLAKMAIKIKKHQPRRLVVTNWFS